VSKAAALLLECGAILAYFAIAQRYAADFYPLLVVSFVVFLRRGGMMRWHMPRIIIGLPAISICVNTLTTILWLRECDQNDRHRFAMAGIASFGVEQLHPDH